MGLAGVVHVFLVSCSKGYSCSAGLSCHDFALSPPGNTSYLIMYK